MRTVPVTRAIILPAGVPGSDVLLPYEAVKKLDDGAVVGNKGFDLVLSGRLRALAGGRVIRCVVEGPDAPPACIVSASFDHVWIEDAASKDRIADWSSS